MLFEEFLKPLHLSQMELAKMIRVSYPRINEIVKGKRGITPDTALRLAQLFGTTPEYWLNGQRNWDLWHAKRSQAAKDISQIVLDHLRMEECHLRFRKFQYLTSGAGQSHEINIRFSQKDAPALFTG